MDDDVFARLAARLSYVSGDFADASTYAAVRSAIGDARRPVFYLEIPPFLFGTVVNGLGAAGLTRDARVVVEKPFGHDLASARALAAELHAVLAESQILRIDHFLGKMGLEELLFLRFANTMLEPMWNRNYLSAVHVTMAENFGVEDRGHFYDPVGALRDVVVNHLLQVVAATAMEAPAGGDPETLKDAQLAVFRAVADADPAHYVRGQYDGYLATPGVAADSTTETYTALRLEIDNWRWSGVPFFIRTGKHLAVRQTELRLVFKEPPRLGFGIRGERPAEPARRQARSGDGRAAHRRRPAGRCPGARADHPRHAVRRRGRRGPDTVRGAPACCARRRHDPVHPPGRCRGAVADHAAATRRTFPRAPVPGRLDGTRRGRRARSWSRRLARPLAAVSGVRPPLTRRRPHAMCPARRNDYDLAS